MTNEPKQNAQLAGEGVLRDLHCPAKRERDL
jgi:hypothetical protein